MKLILFVLFCTIFPVQSKIRSLNKTQLIKAGDPVTLLCLRPSAEWKLGAKTVADCQNCPSSACVIGEDFKRRVVASCNETNSVIHFKSTQITDKGGLKCSNEQPGDTFQLLVGSYDNHLRSENTFALDRKSYTLICDKEENANIKLYNQEGKELSHFDYECNNLYPFQDTKRLDTCDVKQKKGRFRMKVVTLKEDGDIYGCESGGKLSLYRLTVNVAVISVSIKQKSKTLIENKEGIFICEVKRSKPEAFFQWITFDQNGKEDIHMQFNVSKTRNGKLWQTTSNLKLKLKRTYQKIKCRARIEDMPWKDSSDQLLYIQYPPEKVSITQTSYLEGQKTSLICNASGGNAAVYNYTWSPGNHPHEKTIEINLTKADNKKEYTCKVYDEFSGDNPVSSTIKLKVEYPPEKVSITQTSYLEGQKTSLICNASGGNAAVYNYTWSPGNHPHEKTIEINLTKADNKKEYTCKVYDEFSGDNPVSSTIKLKVEYLLPPDHPVNIAVYVVPAIIIILIIIGGILLVKHRRSKKTQGFNNPSYNDGSPKGVEIHSKVAVPKSPGHEIREYVDRFPGSSGDEKTPEPIYEEIYDVPKKSSEPEYIHPAPQNSEPEYIHPAPQNSEPEYIHPAPQNSGPDSVFVDSDSNYENASKPPIITDSNYENASKPPIITGQTNYQESRA